MRLHRRFAVLGIILTSLAFSGLGLASSPRAPQMQTAADSFTTGQGISSDALRGWIRGSFQGGVVGLYHEILFAPLCGAANVTGCRSSSSDLELIVELSVERAASQATPSGDELPASLAQLGYRQAAVTVGGYAGARFTAPDTSQTYAQVVVIEASGVYYHLAFSQGFSSVPTLIDDILATTALQPDQAPAPFIRGGSQSPEATATPPVGIPTPFPSATPSPSPTPGAIPAPSALYSVYLPLVARETTVAQGVTPTARRASMTLSAAATLNGSFNYSIFIDQALFYGSQRTNPGGCYIARTDTEPYKYSCIYGIPYIIGLDGAHFIDCMLLAANYPGAHCSASDPHNTMAGLRVFLLSGGARIINTSIEQPIAGDVVILNYVGDYCWGGVVTSIISGVPYVMAHSRETPLPGYTAGSMRCEDNNGNPLTPSIEYLRLDSEAPYAWFTAPGAGVYAPSDLALSYDGSDTGSGVASFTLRYTKEGAAKVLVGSTTARTSTVRLDLPCRAITAEVIARDYANNADENRKGSLNLFLLLRGDVDGDGALTRADLEAIRDAEGLEAGQAGFSVALDPTDDGRVDAADRLFVQGRMGSTCPQP